MSVTDSNSAVSERPVEIDDRIPIAATDGRPVDWIDVTGWGAFKGHAIPIDVARFIAEKINLYATHAPHQSKGEG